MASIKRTAKDWEDYREKIRASTPIDANETDTEKKKRIQYLLDNPIEFHKYYFPKIVTNEPAKFQKAFCKKSHKATSGIYVLRWFRGASKTTYVWMTLLHRMFNGDTNFAIWAEDTYDKATESLNIIKAELLDNQRLKNDYGSQITAGQWEQGDFITQIGCRFLAIGKGQSPRGFLYKQYRPDTIILNDIDTDEECRNPERLDQSWEWTTGGLFGCFGAKGGVVFVANNKIAEDCLTERLSNLPSAIVQIVHIETNGVSNWPELFTPELIQLKRDNMPEYMWLREMFEEIIKPGKTFKKEWIQDGKVPDLRLFKYLVAYTDPGFKNTGTSDNKAVVLMGLYKAKFYIIKAFVDTASVKTMIAWNYETYLYVRNKNGVVQMFMEQVFLQDLLFKDFAEEALIYGYPLPLIGDTRKKPDKDTRIEALAFIFEKGNVIFNEEEKENHHMKRLKDQFLFFQKGAKKVKKDGPDAVEGAREKLLNIIISEPKPITGKNKPNPKFKV